MNENRIVPEAIKTGPGTGPEAAGRRRGPIRSLIASGILLAVFLIGGFGLFTLDVTFAAPPADPHADGIVVLTGGAARIERGVQLLREGRAKRLLISGLDAKTSQTALARTMEHQDGSLIACCADVDHAPDTLANAAETKRWVEGRGYRSLIVVTSDYHMRRSLAELAASMPGVKLIPYPVGDADEAPGQRNERSVKLLFAEFLKYVAARMRLFIETPNGRPSVEVAAKAN